MVSSHRLFSVVIILHDQRKSGFDFLYLGLGCGRSLPYGILAIWKSEVAEVKSMKIIEVKNKTTMLVGELLKVWESSVKATHLFLSDDEICNIRQYVPQALNGVPILVVAEDENGNPVGFMGVSDKMLEMLFISNENRGQGIGKQLLQYGIENYSINELAVNEQNPLAKGFYEHMGFAVYKRTKLDEQGNPYPLLYMKRNL